MVQIGGELLALSFLSYRADARMVVDGVSLSIAPGSVVGIVGPNGAGKSTLLRLISGLLPPSAGDAVVFGRSVVAEPAAVAALVGYLSPDDVFDPASTCAELLRFYAACFGVPAVDHAQLVDDLLELVDLRHCRDAAVAELTPGMQRRLGLARALVNNPSVLLLDEPLRGLDPRARVDFRALIGDLCSAGRIVLLTADSPADVSDVAAGIVHMAAGRVVAVDDASASGERTLALYFLGDAAVAEQIVRSAVGVTSVQHGPPPDALHPYKEMRFTFAARYADASGLLRALTHSAAQVVALYPPPPGGGSR